MCESIGEWAGREPMVPYIALFAVIICCCFLEVGVGRKKFIQKDYWLRRIITSICFSSVLLFGVLRDENMGVDTVSYYTWYFLLSDELSWNEVLFNIKRDVGFVILSKVICMYTDSYWVWRAVVYTICISLYFVSFYKKAKYVSVAVFLFCATTSWEMSLYIFRQSMAMGICLLGYVLFGSRKMMARFGFMIILATFFHKTALLCLVYLIVYYLRMYGTINGQIRYGLFFFSSFVLITVGMPHLIGLYQIDYSNRLGFGGELLLLLLCAFSLVLYWVYRENRRLKQVNCYMAYMMNVFLYTIVIQVGALSLSVFTRGKAYFTMMLFFIIPEMIFAYDDMRNRMILLFLMLSFFGSYYLFVMYKPMYICA